MAGRKSVMNLNLEELVISSPVRRRSRVAQQTLGNSLKENDDEMELLVRRVENNRPQLPQAVDRRSSLVRNPLLQMSNPQISEKMQQCIQLNAENKINIKNAFSLQMIDFMSYMVKKKAANMSDLTVASTSLDVSTKIYGLRVDGVHSDILRMSNSFDKQAKNDGKRNSEATDNENGKDGDNETDAQVQGRKKRKNNRKIIIDTESLKGPTETVNPYTSMMAMGDTQTTDMLYLATIPYHTNRGAELYLYDHAVSETVDPEKEGNIEPLKFPKIHCPDDLEICASFENFEILGWSVDDEKDELTPVESMDMENEYEFDLDASLPREDEQSNVGMNYFNNDEDNEEIDRCERITQAPLNIVDFREILQTVSSNRNFEYSYFQVNMNIHWAGPSHWKIRHLTKNLTNSRVVGRCEQEPIKRRKEVIMIYNDKECENGISSFAIAKGNLVKLQTKTTKNSWIYERITTPKDMHYAVTDTCKLYGRPQIIIDFPQKEDVANATHVSDENCNYDYNNEHDTTDYCPNIGSNDQPDGAENIVSNGGSSEENTAFSTQALTGDNLVEIPKLTNEIILAYSQRAKKIDMRQLKNSIWKHLTSSGVRIENKENTEVSEQIDVENNDKVNGTIIFSKVFEELPKTLSKNNTEALSLPLAFMSLLHLANEKNLIIEANTNRSDIHVQQM